MDFQNAKQGAFAERAAAEKWDFAHAPNEADWYDCVGPNEEKLEVKSTVVTLASGSAGRFRLWEDQHISLTAADKAGSAWYAFVLLSGGSTQEVVAIKRMRPKDVTPIVRADGGTWNLAGHEKRPGRQHKVLWSEVFSEL